MIYHDRDTSKKAKNREEYYWYKEHGICTRCRQNKVYSPRSNTMCLQCLEDQKEYKKNKKTSTEERHRHNMHLKRYHELLTAFGVCIVCAKRDAAKGNVCCDICLAKIRIKDERRRRQKGELPKDFRSPVICATCHKEKPDNGRKLCDRCYNNSVMALEKARQKQNTENHYWQSDNKIVFHGRNKHDRY